MNHRPGPRNAITDVAGLLVGHATDERVATGVTALLCPDLWTAAVDIRGGGPGGRESAVMDPENLVPGINGVILTGGSVYGLAAADGATVALAAQGIGLRLAPEGMPIPILPAAVLHDLTSDGDKAWGLEPPYRRLGMEAVAAASAEVVQGSVGAGRGATTGRAKGGIGTASLMLEGGLVVGAIVAANAIGSAYMPDGETFWAWPFEIDEEFGGRRPGPDMPPAIDPAPALSKLAPKVGGNTMIGAIATNAKLDRGAAKRLAIMAQDGFARAVRPAHTPFDGDTMFALASGAVDIDGAAFARTLAILGTAAADCVARAVARAIWEARTFS